MTRLFLFLLAPLMLSDCTDLSVPESLRTPDLPSVSVTVDGNTIVLTAEFKNPEDKAACVEYGFYFGSDGASLERLKATKSEGLEYSLTREGLEYSRSYFYKAWLGNGRDEIATELDGVTTEDEPVGPEPPEPVDQTIHFKDDVVKAICVENWDLDGDGELSKSEAASVRDLKMVFRRNALVTSFEELEYFTGLKAVADSAFAGCGNLGDLKLPESVTGIGQRAFLDCVELRLSSLPSHLTVVGTHAFAGCAKMPLTSLPETITEIGNWAFARCASISLTSLPPDLPMIDSGVFSNCPGVTPAELPPNINYIGEWAFFECKNFNPKSLPSTVREIGKHAFQGCDALALTSLPDGLLEIGEYAFWFCYKLKLTSLPPMIFTVRKGLFENCLALESISMPDNLEEICEKAFANCRFVEFTIPKNVRFIGPDAFSGCSHLRLVTVLAVDPPCLEDTFLCENANVIYVPEESLEKYRLAANWSEWKNKIKPIDSGKTPDPDPDSGTGTDPDTGSGTGSGSDPEPEPSPGTDSDGVSYIDGGVDYGKGINISGTVWAPVNCGYHPESYPFGKLYQWGRRFGFGYSDSNFKDASTPVLKQGPVTYTEGNLERNSNVFFNTSYGPWMKEDDVPLWNTGTESKPVKTENDPCPSGWRVPTFREISALKSHYSALVTENGQKGRWFFGSNVYGTEAASIFLPVAGYIDVSGTARHRQVGNSYDNPEGLYWCSAFYGSAYYVARGLRLTPSYVDIVYGQADAYSVRCVAE